MRVHDYTHAVLELLEGGTTIDTALQGLRETLNRRGHTALYPKILRALLTESEKMTKRTHGVVTVAKESDKELWKDAITHALTLLKTSEHTTRIDPTITGGFIAETRDTLIDKSYKTKLLTLYRTLIN